MSCVFQSARVSVALYPQACLTGSWNQNESKAYMDVDGLLQPHSPAVQLPAVLQNIQVAVSTL